MSFLWTPFVIRSDRRVHPNRRALYRKKLYTRAGVEGRPTTFLFSDTQVKDEAFLEDINNILSSGEVPNLYTKDEKAALMDEMRPIAKKIGGLVGTAEELWTLFIDRVRANLHVVLCMSPIGDAFRNRLRQYPAFVNTCTIVSNVEAYSQPIIVLRCTNHRTGFWSGRLTHCVK